MLLPHLGHPTNQLQWDPRPRARAWTLSPFTWRLRSIRLFATPRTVAHQAPPSMGFSRQEYWSGVPFPSPGHLPNPGIEPTSHYVSCTASRFFTTSTTWETQLFVHERIQKWRQYLNSLRFLFATDAFFFQRLEAEDTRKELLLIECSNLFGKHQTAPN